MLTPTLTKRLRLLLAGPLLLLCLLCWHGTVRGQENLVLRNPYGLDNYRESEHFAVFWGSGIALSTADQTLVIAEQVWDRLIAQMDFARPPTTKQFKLNIYISGTGQVPNDDEDSGFAGKDLSGHEQITVHKNTLASLDGIKQGISHEFFHTIQMAYHQYYESMLRGGWLAEAGAQWGTAVVFPDENIAAKNALAQYAFYPQYGLDYLSPPREGSLYLLSGHHYGSYLFFRYLDEELNDDTWLKGYLVHAKRAGAELRTQQALEVLDGYLSETYGRKLTELYPDFAARNAVWDYPQGESYQQALQAWHDGSYQNQRISKVHNTLAGQWHDAPQATLPHRWGSNYIQLTDLSSANIEVGFEGNNQGSQGNNASWSLTLVAITDGRVHYDNTRVQGNSLYQYPVNTEGVDELWLAISLTNTSFNDDEVFNYRYQLAPAAASVAAPQTPLSYASDTVTTPASPDIDKGGVNGGSSQLLGLLMLGALVIGRKVRGRKIVRHRDNI